MKNHVFVWIFLKLTYLTVMFFRAAGHNFKLNG